MSILVTPLLKHIGYAHIVILFLYCLFVCQMALVYFYYGGEKYITEKSLALLVRGYVGIRYWISRD